MTSIDVLSATTEHHSTSLFYPQFSPTPSFLHSLSPIPAPSPSCSLPSDLLSPLSPKSIDPSIPCINTLYNKNNHFQNKGGHFVEPPFPPPRRADSFFRVEENIRQLKSLKRLSVSLPTLSNSLKHSKAFINKPYVMSVSSESIHLRNTSPPPPPPPPSYLFPQLSDTEDLPLPSPPDMTDNKISLSLPIKKKNPFFVYSYDPPSPEEKGIYDPPSFHTIQDEKVSKVISPVLENTIAPCRPDPPPPPTPPVRQSSKDSLFPIPSHTDTQPPNTDSDNLQEYPPSSCTESLHNEEIVNAFQNDTVLVTNASERTDSLISTSTLSATLLLTQDSNVSPLPPHDQRVSPLLTDSLHETPEPISSSVTDNLTSSTNSIFNDERIHTPDDYTDKQNECNSPFTVSSENTISPNAFSYTDAQTLLSSTMTEDFLSLPTERTSNSSETSFSSSSYFDLNKDSSSDFTTTPGFSDTLDCLTPSTLRVSSENLFSLEDLDSLNRSSDRVDRCDESVEVEFGSKTNKDMTEISSSIVTTLDKAKCDSPISIETQSVSSLPTDTITMNAAYESNGTDTEVQSIFDDSPGTLVNNIVNERPPSLIVEAPISSPELSEIAYTTADSAFESPSNSPNLTESSVTPLHTEYLTPASNNTPFSSPVPSIDVSSTEQLPLGSEDKQTNKKNISSSIPDDNTYEDIELVSIPSENKNEKSDISTLDLCDKDTDKINEVIIDCIETIYKSGKVIMSPETDIDPKSDTEVINKDNMTSEGLPNEQLQNDLHNIFETTLLKSDLESTSENKPLDDDNQSSKSFDSQNRFSISDQSRPTSCIEISPDTGLSLADTNALKKTLQDLSLIEKAEVARNSLTIISPPRTPKDAIRILDTLTETLDSLSAELLTRYPKTDNDKNKTSGLVTSLSVTEGDCKKLSHKNNEESTLDSCEPPTEKNVGEKNITWETNDMYMDINGNENTEKSTEENTVNTNCDNNDTNGNILHCVEEQTEDNTDSISKCEGSNENVSKNEDNINDDNSLILYNKVTQDAPVSTENEPAPSKLRINGDLYIPNNNSQCLTNVENLKKINYDGSERCNTPSFSESVSNRHNSDSYPPSPPPRHSSNFTPKFFTVEHLNPPAITNISSPPLPPPRQYMLIPISQGREVPQCFSPPIAPPRSTSLRRSPPPPIPNKSDGNVSSELSCIRNQHIESAFENALQIITEIPKQSKLTPVPEETSSIHSLSPLPRTTQNTSPVPRRSKSPLDPSNLPKSRSTSPSLMRRSPALLTKSKDDEDCIPPEVPPRPTIDQELLNKLPPVPPPPPPISLRGLGGNCSFFPQHPHSPNFSKRQIPLPPPPPPVRIKPLSTSLPCTPKIILPTAKERSLSPPPPPPPPIDTSQDNIISPNLPPLPPPPQQVFHSHSPKPSKSITENRNSVVKELEEMIKASETKQNQSTNQTDVSSVVTDSAVSSIIPDSSTCDTPPSPPSSVISSSPDHQLISMSPYGKMVVNRSDLPLPLPEEEIRKSLRNSLNWGWLHPDMDTLSVYTQLRPIIQQGPQCGLVSLSMATQICEKTILVQDILHEARKRQFTRHGEMFSATDMCNLITSLVNVEATVHRDVLCNPKIFLQILLQGDLILVPYDAEPNNLPGLKNGHKAHWGVITGCLAQSPSVSSHIPNHFHADNEVDKLWHYRPTSRGTNVLEQEQHKEETKSNSRSTTPQVSDMFQQDITVIALWRHGKSRNLMAAPLQELCESNEQLIEYAPNTETEMDYIIKSVKDGLCGQVVVLHKTKSALSDMIGAVKI